MRISTQGFYTGSVAAMLEQQAALARTQNQVATGRRVNTPADDPIAAVRILELERTLSESQQFDKNSALVANRLNLEEQALADTGTLLTRVRELVLQASNIGTLTENDRKSIAVELEARVKELQDIANRKDANSEYLFAGFSTLMQPFSRDASGGMTYAGDQGSRLLQVGAAQRVADGHSGFDVFMSIPQGNGTFTTSAAAANAGSGIIDVGAVINRSDWAPDNYTLTFTTATDWAVTDGAAPPNIVAQGAYTPGGAIEFNGVRVAVSGTPAAGDAFAINQSRSEALFTTLDGIIAALRASGMDETSNARLATSLGGSLQQLDRAADHLLGLRAQVGARLSLLEAADNTRENLRLDIASSLSDLRDLDYAQAMTQLNQQLLGLQAAQLSYTKIAQLSLFNYM